MSCGRHGHSHMWPTSTVGQRWIRTIEVIRFIGHSTVEVGAKVLPLCISRFRCSPQGPHVKKTNLHLHLTFIGWKTNLSGRCESSDLCLDHKCYSPFHSGLSLAVVLAPNGSMFMCFMWHQGSLWRTKDLLSLLRCRDSASVEQSDQQA